MRISFGNCFANSFAKHFFSHLATSIRNEASGDAEHIVGRAKKSAQILFDAERHNYPEKRARFILGWSVITLAGYREVLRETGDSQKAFDTIREASNRTFRAPIQMIVRAMLRVVRNPVAFLSRMPITGLSLAVAGPRLALAHTFKTADKTTLTVTHCPFHHFFVEHGEPQLTRILCEWDRMWLDVFDASTRPIRSERPSTISTGGKSCQFHLIHDRTKIGMQNRDVILGWASTPFIAEPGPDRSKESNV